MLKTHVESPFPCEQQRFAMSRSFSCFIQASSTPHHVILSLASPDSGGNDILLQHGGTEAYEAFEEVGHSDFARGLKTTLEQTCT